MAIFYSIFNHCKFAGDFGSIGGSGDGENLKKLNKIAVDEMNPLRNSICCIKLISNEK